MPLTEKQDAMGRGYLNYFNGDLEAGIVIDRDDGYSEIGMECRPYFADYSDWSPMQQNAISHVKGRVLDVGCGAGRHCLYLQQNGHAVVGIDNSPIAIQICHERGVQDARVLAFTQIGSGLGTFDTILMMGNNFGLFANAMRARRLLKRLHQMTSANARIVAETSDPYATSNPSHLAYHERNRQLGRMGGQIRMRARYGNHTSPWFDYLLVSREELKSLLSGTGWELRQTLDSDRPVYIAIICKSG